LKTGEFSVCDIVCRSITDPLGHKWCKAVSLANEKHGPDLQYKGLNDLLWGNCIHIHFF